jgi:hypothetical protein
MLIAALGVISAAVLIGLVLGALYMIKEEPPTRVMLAGWAHGALGALGVTLTLLALRGVPRGVKQGAGSVGWLSGTILSLTLAGGLLILIIHLRRKQVPALLIAMHATLGIAGYVMLAAYFSMPISYGR